MDPPEIADVVLPAFEQGLEDVALVELGIAGQRCAELRNKRRRVGTQIGTIDALLAQLCLRHDLTYETMRKLSWSRSGWPKSSVSLKIQCAGCWNCAIGRKWRPWTQRSRK
jgi:hypothetical protein